MIRLALAVLDAAVPTDLTDHIAVCTHKDCYYVYGCPTYYFLKLAGTQG